MRFPTESMFREQLSVLSRGYEKLGKLYIQQASNKKLLANSDDPVLANRIEITYNYLNDLNSYSQSSVIAKNRTQLFDTSISDATDKVDQIRQLISRALNDTTTDVDRAAMAEQIKGYLKSLLGDANIKDGNGDYIYSGYNTGSIPYVLSNNKYQYQGGSNSTNINIGDNVSSLYNENGFKVFGNIPDGNGVFTVKGDGANTGTAYSTPGSVTNASVYVKDTYTVSFVTNSDGKLAYQVVGAASGQVVPPPPASIPADAPEFIPDGDIGIPGMALQFSGTPNVGDTFTIATSQNQNIFDEINDLTGLLQLPVDGDPAKHAALRQMLSQAGDYFGSAYNHLIGYRSEVGVRMQVIENQISTNKNLMLQESSTYATLSDIKREEVASQLGQQLISLQATQDCYKLIQASFMQLFKIL